MMRIDVQQGAEGFDEIDIEIEIEIVIAAVGVGVIDILWIARAHTIVHGLLYDECRNRNRNVGGGGMEQEQEQEHSYLMFTQNTIQKQSLNYA